MQEFEGVYKSARDGIGFVKDYETGESYEISPANRNTAQNRDKILVQKLTTDSARVIQILKRAKYGYAGILKKDDHGSLTLSPMDWKDSEVIIDVDTDIKPNHIVFAVPTKYENDKVFGRIEKDLGPAETADAQMHGIALERGFDSDFPPDVDKEAQKIHERGFLEEDFKLRRDMRDVPTITIDPADAKDFDDALSFQIKDEDTYEIGIHIADVSHYVRPGTPLDQEAYHRATSVYMVDRTIPMLPEELSNDLCSINPNQDRLAFSVVCGINRKTGEITDQWFGRTVIHSDRRFSYEEAQSLCDEGVGEWSGELAELVRIAQIYEAEKYARGALNTEIDEIKFELDESGHPLRVIVKERLPMHRMIEEFMLLANVSVSMFLEENADASLYRIHDTPDPERVEQLGEFLRSFNFQVEFDENGQIPSHILQKIIDESAEHTTDTIQTSIIRSMQKAVYSAENIGHFGLARDSYTHFTSPIRRYPDLIVHRILAHTLGDSNGIGYEASNLSVIAQHCSDREKEASDAERESIRAKQIEFMADRIGKEFDATVVGASKFGLFVSERESRSEGMIPMRNLGRDYYVFDEKAREIYGERSGIRFSFGMPVRIRVDAVDMKKKNINYILLDH